MKPVISPGVAEDGARHRAARLEREQRAGIASTSSAGGAGAHGVGVVGDALGGGQLVEALRRDAGLVAVLEDLGVDRRRLALAAVEQAQGGEVILAEDDGLRSLSGSMPAWRRSARG